jgi:hypothetical protein
MLDFTDKADSLLAVIKSQIKPIRNVVIDIHESTSTKQKEVGAGLRQLSSLGELLQHWTTSWQAQAIKYTDSPSTTAWCAQTLPFDVREWPIATAVTMANVRKTRFVSKEPIRSPFAILPGYIRALGPHQGHRWWNFNNNSRHDIHAIHAEMIADHRHAKNGVFKRFSKQKEVRCIIYNFDTIQFSPDDVVQNVNRLGLNLVDELQPRMASNNPLVDIRVTCMTTYLWRLLELRSVYIDSFVFSITARRWN